MKNLVHLFLLISFFSFSQEEITVIDFVKGDYPFDKKVKILFDKDWRPTVNILFCHYLSYILKCLL